jgi:hypothetical protein
VAAAFEPRAAGLDRALDHRGERHATLAELEAIAADAADIEQIVEQPRHLPDLALDHVAQRVELRIGRPFRAQHVQGVEDRRERVAQLVRQRGEELVLAAIRVAQGVGGDPLVVDVDRGPHPLRDAALLVADRNTDSPEPAVFTVGLPPRAVLDVDRLAGLQCALPVREDAGPIVGM